MLMASITELDLPALPFDVLEFAREQDVTSVLCPVAELTRDVFPNAPISLRLEDDPEVPDDRHIVVEVDLTGCTVDQMFVARNRWNQLFFKACPESKLWVFRLRMRLRK